MKKQRAPLLGFIGSIIGPMIGVMASDDEEEYENHINEVNDSVTSKVTQVLNCLKDNLKGRILSLEFSL